MGFKKSELYAYIVLQELKRKDRVALPEISAKYDIPLNFLYKLTAKLKKAGLIESKEGVDGGYTLAKADGISLYDMMQAIGESQGIACQCDGTCSRHDVCASFSTLQQNLISTLKNVSI